jgi:fusion protein PurCD
MQVLVIGNGAREQAIILALSKSTKKPNIFCIGSNFNPGIDVIGVKQLIGDICNPEEVINFAQKNTVELAIIGPEAPLEAGISDSLQAKGIPVVGPKKSLAQLETSKSFTRDLLSEYGIEGSPSYRTFDSMDGLEDFITEIGGEFVIKADGLMGGKGVKVKGDHFQTTAEGLTYCQELLENGSKFVIEEKLVGQEFSLMTFCDGINLVNMPPVQDHKRAYDGDEGPNTGGMGSYSDADHSLPFLSPEDIQAAGQITAKVARALREKFEEGYKGILYGGFMATKDGIRLIEYNARFGDPECMNVLSVLQSDFLEICQGITEGNLDTKTVSFLHLATVCKYLVPMGYPDKPIKDQAISLEGNINPETTFFASVDKIDEQLILKGSRAIAILGVGSTLEEAANKAEKEIEKISGPLFYRKDIGTRKLIKQRVDHLANLRKY